jgi:hypothetical protein
MILKSELNARNKITVIAVLAVPVLRYSFGIINSRLEKIKQIDRKTRKITDKNYEHIPESVINANDTTIMWDVPVIKVKDQTILANRPDKVLHDKNREYFPTDTYSHT